jgi:hypothetical protein
MWHSDTVEYQLGRLAEELENDPAGIEPSDILEGLENFIEEYRKNV